MRKNSLDSVIRGLIVVASVILLIALIKFYKNQKNSEEVSYVDTIEFIDSIDTTYSYKDSVVEYEMEFNKQLQSLTDAFAFVESRFTPDAVNGNCVGILQISPIMVRECNRISGYQRFSLNDRYSQLRSYEMFSLIMTTYNPILDIKLACDIWNPGHKDSYHEQIYDKFLEYYYE